MKAAIFQYSTLTTAIGLLLTSIAFTAQATQPPANDSSVVPSAMDSSTRSFRSVNLNNPAAATSSSPYIQHYQQELNAQTGSQPSSESQATQIDQTPQINQTAQIDQQAGEQPVVTAIQQAVLDDSQVFSQSDSSQPVMQTRIYQPHPMTTQGTVLKGDELSHIPTPQLSVHDISFIPTVIIAQDTINSKQLDVSLLDDFINEASPNARHYPPNFPNRSQQYHTREKVKAFVEWIEPYASYPNASYEVLLRSAKLNGMARNLDLGSDYAVRASTHIAKAIDRQPNSAEANFLYGMMLAEGGGFKEGQKYLDKAVSLGYTEAEQSLAQSDLLNDRRSQALERLHILQTRHPDNAIIPQQIALIEAGKFYIWDIPAPDINIQPGMSGM